MNPVEIEMNFPAEHGGNVFGQFENAQCPETSFCAHDEADTDSAPGNASPPWKGVSWGHNNR